jgi:hypothetical protein
VKHCIVAACVPASAAHCSAKAMALSQHVSVPHGVSDVMQCDWKHDHEALPESKLETLIGAMVPQSIAAAMPLVLPLRLPLMVPLLPLLPPLATPLLAVSPPPSPPVAAVSSPPHPVAIAPMIAPNPENPKSHCEGRMMFEASLEARRISGDPRVRQ